MLDIYLQIMMAERILLEVTKLRLSSEHMLRHLPKHVSEAVREEIQTQIDQLGAAELRMDKELVVARKSLEFGPHGPAFVGRPMEMDIPLALFRMFEPGNN